LSGIFVCSLSGVCLTYLDRRPQRRNDVSGDGLESETTVTAVSDIVPRDIVVTLGRLSHKWANSFPSNTFRRSVYMIFCYASFCVYNMMMHIRRGAVPLRPCALCTALPTTVSYTDNISFSKKKQKNRKTNGQLYRF